MWITENGVCTPGEAKMAPQEAVRDDWRLAFFRDYLDNACTAVVSCSLSVSLSARRGTMPLATRCCGLAARSPAPASRGGGGG